MQFSQPTSSSEIAWLPYTGLVRWGAIRHSDIASSFTYRNLLVFCFGFDSKV
jgi:hypothetical protein